jgi:hypothetical protein
MCKVDGNDQNYEQSHQPQAFITNVLEDPNNVVWRDTVTCVLRQAAGRDVQVANVFHLGRLLKDGDDQY